MKLATFKCEQIDIKSLNRNYNSRRYNLEDCLDDYICAQKAFNRASRERFLGYIKYYFYKLIGR